MGPQDTQELPPVAPPPQRSRRKLMFTAGAAGAALLLIGAGIGAAAHGTTIKTVAGPTVTKYVNVPGPVQYKTKTVKVPGPTVYKTKTVYVPASQGPTGTTIATFTGSGNQATGNFGVPASGDYYVKWSYGSNNDCSFGSCQGSNFSISENNSQSFSADFPNDIAGSGSGSTEITGDSGSPSFNVQGIGGDWWKITVVSAP